MKTEQTSSTKKVIKPWGQYVVLGDHGHVLTKNIIVNESARLSLQRHTARDEAWYILFGTANVTLEDDNGKLIESLYYAGECLWIPKNRWHRLSNYSNTQMLVVHETQVGNPSEEDIERIEDDYGRTGETLEG